MKNMSQVVYAGTFDPITHGHLDIIRRAVSIFGGLTVAVADNPSKNVLFAAQKRKELIEGALGNIADVIKVQVFDSLLVDFCHSIGAKIIVRGLRAVSDYEYEAQMAILNRQLAEDIETVFLMTSKDYSFVSSSLSKDVAKHSGDVSALVPPNVEQELRAVFQ